MGVVGNTLNVLLLLFATIDVIHGQFRYNFFDTFGLSASDISVDGTEAATGPTIKGMPDVVTKAIDFTEDTKGITLDDAKFAYIADTIQKSEDITFAVYFKIHNTDEKKHIYFPFFSLSNTKGDKNYFSIGLESKAETTRVEGRVIFTGKIRWSINIEQFKSKSTRKTSLPNSDQPSLNIKLEEWMTLMVRIKNADVTVSLDCNEVTSGKLMEGRIGAFSYDGKLRFSQTMTPWGLKQFVGSLFEPQLINGQLAYDWYNPCTRDNKPSEVDSEPTIDGYDNSKFEKFQKMNGQKFNKTVIFCTDVNDKSRRNNGDPWYKENSTCYRYKCVNGEIQEFYDCTKCEDEDDETIKYKADEAWISKTDKCTRMKCVEIPDYDTETVEEKIVCPELDCQPEDQYTPEGACCPKCRQDDCTQKRVWHKGCERKCYMGKHGECQTTTKACWCGKGMALNLEEDECVPIGECKCKVDSGKIYLAGQSIKRSLCSNCICQQGLLNCFDIC